MPLFAADGQPVFLAEHLTRLAHFFDEQFGGCTGASNRSGIPLIGEYLPAGKKPVRDYNTITFVYANPIDASDELFTQLKPILRAAPLIPQDEILIERTEVFLV